MSEHYPPDEGNPDCSRNLGIIPTEKERRDEYEAHQKKAQQEADNDYKDRQIGIGDSANKLARNNLILTGIVGLFTAVAAGAAIYQGVMNHRSWVAASSTLEQMRIDAAGNSAQFQAQIRHYDDGLGRTGLIATHAGEQVEATNGLVRSASSQAISTAGLLEQSIQQLKVSKGQLDLSNRPWMSVQLSLYPGPPENTPIWKDQNGRLNIALLIQAQNIGKSPAMLVNAAVQAFSPIPNNVENVQMKMCDAEKQSRFNGPGDAVFPNAPFQLVRHTWLTNEIRENELISPSNRTVRDHNGNQITFVGNDPNNDFLAKAMITSQGYSSAPSVVLIGCLDYTFDFDKSRHQTMFSYSLDGVDFRSGSSANATFTKMYGIGNSAN